MKITLICVGTVKDPHIKGLCERYLKRLGYYVTITTETIRDSRPNREAGQFLARLHKCSHAHTCALAEEGCHYTSTELSRHLAGLGKNLVFCIGGPDGLAPAVKDAAHEQLSLSPLTFPHEMARLLLLEQLFRAFSLQAGRGYHR